MLAKSENCLKVMSTTPFQSEMSKISSFKHNTSSQSTNYEKPVLSDHHTLLKWKFSKFSPCRTRIPTLNVCHIWWSFVSHITLKLSSRRMAQRSASLRPEQWMYRAVFLSITNAQLFQDHLSNKLSYWFKALSLEDLNKQA